MKPITIELLMQVKDSFLDKIKKGRRGTFTWSKVEIEIPAYAIHKDELTDKGTAKIDHLVVPRRKVTLSIEINVDRVKGKKTTKRRN